MIEKFRQSGIEITPEQEERLRILMDFMLEYNKYVNLTRITEYDEVIEKHYIDSILPLTMVDVPRGTKFVDIGTGAGFPSLPMKIYRPDIEFTLIDSLGKRITYLDKACEKIGLPCETVHARSEEAARNKKYRDSFDFATARAVAALNVLCEYCLPYVKKGGYFLALKGAEDETEVAKEAIEKLGGKLEKVEKYALPSGDKRCLVVIKKISETPSVYPRASGVISKKPL
ncbi:MAG: 16S rRNA (guanine(527)-N(7))-methyltransferase RsmG [Ruminiclostridium sp.]